MQHDSRFVTVPEHVAAMSVELEVVHGSVMASILAGSGLLRSVLAAVAGLSRNRPHIHGGPISCRAALSGCRGVGNRSRQRVGAPRA